MGGGAATQAPPLHFWQLLQGMLQAPQLVMLLLVLTQLLPTPDIEVQQVSPEQQAGPPEPHVVEPAAPHVGGTSVIMGLGLGAVHLPPTQAWPVA
uniref:Uncharacterized protein n=1 Tax=Tetradesmus obliquus TaxID=3088 RepID=A0A383VWR1_TETOB|eukprot:jgi/Sobl393_1/3155/SZX68856.1